jgi:putative Holliday junction resolvase
VTPPAASSSVRRVDTFAVGWQILTMRLLGLDVGQKTLGIAVCDEDERVATPLRTLARRGGQADLEEVARLAEEQEIGGLVLGLPLDLNGREGDAALRVRALGAALSAHLSLSVHYWDERFSTAAAERALLEGDVRRRRRRQVVNHVAAALILQSFIDHRHGEASAARPGEAEPAQPGEGG